MRKPASRTGLAYPSRRGSNAPCRFPSIVCPVAAADDWPRTEESGESLVAARDGEEAFIERLVEKFELPVQGWRSPRG